MDAVLFEAAAIARFATIAAWQAEASQLVATMLERWKLRPGDAFVGGVSGSVLAVTREDASAAVLKVSFPHVESVWEAVGLQAMGRGLAPVVLEQDAWTWSTLLAPVTPGTPLSRAPLAAAEAIAIGADVLTRVHDRPVPEGLPTLAGAMSAYASSARTRMPGQASALEQLGVRHLVTDAVDTLETMAAHDVAPCLLHGDFNPGNVLRSGDGWQVVDPNPLVGDPAYDLWPLVSQLGQPSDGHPDLAALIERQLRLATAATGIDPVRAALWGFARAGLDVSWYLDDGDAQHSAVAVRQLTAWASVCGR